MQLITIRDTLNTLAYGSLAPIAFSLSQARIEQLADKLAAWTVACVGPNRVDIARFKSLIGDRLPQVEPADVFEAAVASTILERIFLLRCHRHKRWQPDVRVAGREHLTRALAQERGVILWVVPFRFSDLVTKIALTNEAIDVAHLSRFSHPGSSSTIGCALLNPVRTRIEARNLAERLVIGRDGTIAGEPPLDVLKSRLKQNRIVSITVGKHARRQASVSLLGGRIRLAIGPVYLALQTSAPILPVFTVRHHDGHFETTFTPALTAPPHGERTEQMDVMLADFAGRMGEYLLQWPEQFPWGRFDD